MIGDSSVEYVLMRICITALHCIVPLSVVYCVAIIASPSPAFRLPAIIELWPVAEVIFWACFFLPHRSYLQRPATHPPLRSRDERRMLFTHVKAEVSDPERYIRGWFKGARIQDIGHQDIKDWLAWAFFDRDRVDAKDEDEIEEYALELESMLDVDVLPLRGTAKPLRLTVDPVGMLHRSLLWYLCVALVDLLACVKLQQAGFEFHRLSLLSLRHIFPFRPVSLVTRQCSPAKHLSYWYRPHTATSRLPVLFIHGIGIGLYPYIDFLSEINPSDEKCDGQVGILAIEIMPISFRITHSALSKDDMCAEICQVLDECDYDRFVLASHSYGSVIGKFILSDQGLRPKVASALFVDPVCFLLHTPDVAYNFTARRPQRASEWQLWYFASQDPGVAHTLGRRFFWSQKVMWSQDVEDFVNDGRRLTVSLGGKDLIVNTEAVGRYLTKLDVANTGSTGQGGENESEPLTSGKDAWKEKEWMGSGSEVLWFECLDHGQVFDEKAVRARLVRVLRNYSDST